VIAATRWGVRAVAVLAAVWWCCAPPAAGAADGDVGAGPWVWPTSGSGAVAAEVARRFEPPARPWLSGHRGVDLAAAAGSTVRAAGEGVVTFVGVVAGRGVVVVAHADGTRTTYEPVLSRRRVGERVAAGDAIGRLAGAGGHCLPRSCLHWGRLRGDVYLDPLALLGRSGPPVLLPVWRPEGSAGALGTGTTGRAPQRDAWTGVPADASQPRVTGRPGRGPPTGGSPRPGAAWGAAGLLGAALVAAYRRPPVRRPQSRAGRSAASRR
jgi:hypothetical protein